MKINYFILIGGLLWIAGAIQAATQNNYRMMIVSICYALAQFALASAE